MQQVNGSRENSVSATDNEIVQKCRVVTDEVSVTLQLLILSHDPNWACVFHKGIASYVFYL